MCYNDSMAKSLSYYRRLWRLSRSFNRKEVFCAGLPIRVWVEISARCNLSCVMCPNKDLSPEAKGDMSFEVFRKTIDQAEKFAFDITLNHRGEALVHPDMGEFLHYLKGRGMVKKLHTNGMLLDQRVSRAIIETPLDRLSFSVDGIEAEEYEKVRRGAKFSVVMENIRRFLRLRREMGSVKPLVAWEFIELQPGGAETIRQSPIYRELRGLGLDELVVKKPHNWGGYLQADINKRKYNCCTFPWNALLVLWNGDVSPCSQDFFAHYILGNINENELEKIWNGPQQARLRSGLAAGSYLEFPHCRDCDRLWRKTFMGIPREYLGQLLLGRMP